MLHHSVYQTGKQESRPARVFRSYQQTEMRNEKIHQRVFPNIIQNKSVQGKSNIKDIFLLVQDRKVF